MSEQDQITALITRPVTLTITTEIQEAQESANLIILRKARKEAEAKFKELKKPFKEGIERLDAEFAAVVDPMKNAEALISAAILRWKQAEQRRIEHEKAEAARQQQELERQAAAKRLPPPPPLTPVVEQAKGWATDKGTLTTRKVKKWRVVDESLIPYEIVHNGETVKLWELVSGNISRIRQGTFGNHSPIPGIEFYEDNTVSVR